MFPSTWKNASSDFLCIQSHLNEWEIFMNAHCTDAHDDSSSVHEVICAVICAVIFITHMCYKLKVRNSRYYCVCKWSACSCKYIHLMFSNYALSSLFHKTFKDPYLHGILNFADLEGDGRKGIVPTRYHSLS